MKKKDKEKERENQGIGIIAMIGIIILALLTMYYFFSHYKTTATMGNPPLEAPLPLIDNPESNNQQVTP